METESRMEGKESGTPSQELTPVVRVEDLSDLIRAKRRREKLTLEQAARQSGVSAATLSRWERQHAIRTSGASGKALNSPDMRTLTAITRWLGVSLERVMDVDSPTRQTGQDDSVQTFEKIAAHLRADRKLKPENAALVTRLFRAIYEEYAENDETVPDQEQ